jgi:phage recombination protein Bet
MNQMTTTNNPALAKFAERFNVDPEIMENTLKTTVFKQSGNSVVSNEQMVMLMVVADQYKLNPFTKEIYAFPDKGGIVPVVGVDGWSNLINSNKHFNGMDFRQSETMIKIDEDAKACPEWIEVVMHRDDRRHPVIVREYLDEVYRPAFKKANSSYVNKGPWQTHTKRMLRHKAMIQGARMAFGFAGIYDEDEAYRIIEANEEPINVTPQPERAKGKSKAEDMAAKLGKKAVNEDTGEVLEGQVLDISAKAKNALKDKLSSCKTLKGLNELLSECANFSSTKFAAELRGVYKVKKLELESENGN